MTESFGEHHVPYTGYTDANLDDSVEGFDPDVALELGIPIDSDTVKSHEASGRQVAELMRTPAELQALTDAAEHAAVVTIEGAVTCGRCNNPGCRGCGSS